MMRGFKTTYQRLKKRLRITGFLVKLSFSREQTEKDISGQGPKTPVSENSSSQIDFGQPAVCSSIEELTMKKYVKVVVDNDLSQLIVNGSPEPEQLEKAKLSIISQYQEACPNPISKQHLSVISKIEMCRTRITRILNIVSCLRINYSESLIEELREDNYRHAFTRETMEADLIKVEESLSGDINKMAKLQEELNSLDRNKPKSKKLTTQDFIKSILQYNAAFGTKYSLYDDNLYTAVYCSMMNELQDHYRTITHKDNGRATH